jgi:DNA-binding CsgD family transcriptional regulator
VLAQVWTAAARGEHSAARSLACRAADIAAAAGLRSAELEALHDAVRLGETRVQPRLAALAAEVDSVLAPVLAGHAAALAGGDADALDRCAARFAELGAPLLAAEAAAEAAEKHHRAGRTAAWHAAQERFRTWASICEGAQTPSLRRAGAPQTLETLTARELEIAELAARGLPKREIADRLVLSVRTVGNHLNHIYTKAGISGRAELALLLGLDAVPLG